MLRTLASLFFYGRFLKSFSVLGYKRRARHWPEGAWNFEGQRWIVTGASGGIGAALSLAAVDAGAEVMAIARSSEKLESLRSAASDPDRLLPLTCDLSSMASIDQLMQSDRLRRGRVDALINNVGVLLNDFSETSEGLETSLATNLLGHFSLTEQLLAAEKLTPDSVVIEVSSGGMYGTPLAVDPMLTASAEEWDGMRAYAFHKRAQVELVRAWNARWSKGPTAHVMHPGWVDTMGVKTALPGFRATLKRVLRSPAQGADTVLWLLDTRPPPAADGGIWLDRCLQPEHEFAYTRRSQWTADDLYQCLEETLEEAR